MNNKERDRKTLSYCSIVLVLVLFAQVSVNAENEAVDTFFDSKYHDNGGVHKNQDEDNKSVESVQSSVSIVRNSISSSNPSASDIVKISSVAEFHENPVPVHSTNPQSDYAPQSPPNSNKQSSGYSTLEQSNDNSSWSQSQSQDNTGFVALSRPHYVSVIDESQNSPEIPQVNYNSGDSLTPYHHQHSSGNHYANSVKEPSKEYGDWNDDGGELYGYAKPIENTYGPPEPSTPAYDSNHYQLKPLDPQSYYEYGNENSEIKPTHNYGNANPNQPQSHNYDYEGYSDVINHPQQQQGWSHQPYTTQDEYQGTRNNQQGWNDEKNPEWKWSTSSSGNGYLIPSYASHPQSDYDVRSPYLSEGYTPGPPPPREHQHYHHDEKQPMVDIEYVAKEVPVPPQEYASPLGPLRSFWDSLPSLFTSPTPSYDSYTPPPSSSPPQYGDSASHPQSPYGIQNRPHYTNNLSPQYGSKVVGTGSYFTKGHSPISPYGIQEGRPSFTTEKESRPQSESYFTKSGPYYFTATRGNEYSSVEYTPTMTKGSLNSFYGSGIPEFDDHYRYSSQNYYGHTPDVYSDGYRKPLRSYYSDTQPDYYSAWRSYLSDKTKTKPRIKSAYGSFKPSGSVSDEFIFDLQSSYGTPSDLLRPSTLGYYRTKSGSWSRIPYMKGLKGYSYKYKTLQPPEEDAYVDEQHNDGLNDPNPACENSHDCHSDGQGIAEYVDITKRQRPKMGNALFKKLMRNVGLRRRRPSKRPRGNKRPKYTRPCKGRRCRKY